jgi:ubiquinone/menaquinone biosynthesis C-methylase UbiE
MALELGIDPKKRFANRGESYDLYRPKYPRALLRYFANELTFSDQSVVADVGSGTGILSELLLGNGNLVFAVEPNEEMRRIAETKLSRYRGFKSINGSAESTTLPADSVDLITAAQSFHWFVPEEARAEFQRILRLNGWVALIWNTRKTSTPFLQGYEELVHWLTSERKNVVKHEDLSDRVISEFMGKYKVVKLDNSQQLDLNGLIGRLSSASYSPLPTEPLYGEFVRRARELFERYERNGTITLEYWTEVYAGQLS